MNNVTPHLVAKMAEALLLAAAAFMFTLLSGRWWIRFLRAKKIGKQIRTEGPESHMIKTGTPTMGGAMIVVTIVVLTIPTVLLGRLSMLLPLATLVSFAILGAFDDFLSLTSTRSRTYGVTARFKMVWLIIIALVASLALYLPKPFGLENSGLVVVPFYGTVDIKYWYIPLATFIIVATSNAVNLTDGLDGLAGWTLTLAFGAYGIIAFLRGFDYLVTYAFTVTGACAAFLWYNAHPAQVFMGDLGALALGATLAIIALQSQQWLLLPIVGVIFVAEALSVMFQVSYFKFTRWRHGEGRRLLKMSPLHNHFVMLGWSETQIVQRFVLIGLIAALVGLSLALNPLPQTPQPPQGTTIDHSLTAPVPSAPEVLRSGGDK